ncbi:MULTISPECIES: hypothetical protein [unclassified Amycolatopsis]|uniref:hypothetical protein n=1 Tax=unclassified Amycolatopsis TaxID=2618356 RepID=UPI002875BC3C|nr:MULTISPECIES: hypothetical protein [unclassified Amycolatopsis]MDS0135934.1 hypothetical protein [Amycolatopsis sp. 505]MDS0145477.1 hypothetical protein [Amycolatopsis sp. CM201R]
MTAPHRDLRLLQQQAAEIDAQLAAGRHTAHSADQLITATVTGQESSSTCVSTTVPCTALTSRSSG